MTRAFRLVWAILPLALAACGGTFEKQWHAAASRAPDATRWEGRWTSSRHKLASGKPAGGRLRCVLAREDAKKYRAHFEAEWLVFKSSYVTELSAESQSGELHLRGEHSIGGFGGGLYHYEGRVKPGAFDACYESEYDAGIFSMAPAKQP